MKTKTGGSWNQRFVEFARVHGRTPEAQIIADTAPGNDRASMHPFVTWNTARLYEYSGVNPKAFYSWTERYGPYNTIVDHKSYDQWLAELPVGHGVREEVKK